MSEQEVVMGVNICLAAWRDDPPGPEVAIEEVAKRAFRMTRDRNYTWFTTDDDVQFRIGCGVLGVHYRDTETFTLIQNTLHSLRAISAAMTGVPVDFSALSEAEETLPLLGWYKETSGG